MMRYQLLVLITYYWLGKTFACQSVVDSEVGEDNGQENQEDPRFGGDPSVPSTHAQHWPVPAGGVDPHRYIKHWKAKQQQAELDAIAANGGHVKSYPDDAGNEWPRHWIGLGLGSGGAAPPPWASDPEGRGRADMCYLPPRTGHCDENKIRWGYNPYLGDCAEFVYSGCGGNTNNFYTKRRCREACHGSPTKQCLHDDKIQFSDYHLWLGPVAG